MTRVTQPPAKLNVSDLSSDRISKVLDILVYMMIEPIVKYTDYGFELAASLLFLLQNNRRKVCSGDRQEAISKLFTALCLRDRELLLETLTTSNFERNLLLYYIGLAIECTGGDDGWSSQASYPPGLTIEFAPLKNHLIVLYEQYNRFRLLIIERYRRVIVSQANRILFKKQSTGVAFSKKDALQNCHLAALKALDKFHSSQGVLTTYLAKWVSSSVSSSFSMGIGESFTLTRNARTRIAKGSLALNNMSVDIETSYEVADTAENGEEALTKDEYFNRLADFLNNTPLIDRFPDAIIRCGIPVKYKRG